MFTKLRESTLFKLLSAAFCFNRESTASKATPASLENAGIQKMGIAGDRSLPDAVWNRSKLARYRRS
jgi:hypothetical protein